MDSEFEYRNRIQQAVKYICHNLDGPLALEEVAKAASFSEYHFHRIFSGFMDETLGNYISRKRLEQGAGLLAYRPDISITDIALRCGYSSSSNFSKAFSLHFGYSPSEVRNPAKAQKSKMGKLKSKYGKEFSAEDLYPDFELRNQNDHRQQLMEVLKMVEVKEIESVQLAYISSPKGYDLDSVKQTWEEISIRAKNIQNKEGETRYAFCHDNPFVVPPEKARYDACIPVKENIAVALPFRKCEIPKGIYACSHFHGSVDELLDTYKKIFASWFPQSEYEPDEFPAIEKYSAFECSGDGILNLEIMIKVKPLNSI